MHSHDHIPTLMDILTLWAPMMNFPNIAATIGLLWVKCLAHINSFEKGEREESEGEEEEKQGCLTSGRNLVYDPLAVPLGSRQEMALARKEVIETMNESKTSKHSREGGHRSGRPDATVGTARRECKHSNTH